MEQGGDPGVAQGLVQNDPAARLRGHGNEKAADQAAVDAALAQLEESAKKIPSLYPASVKDVKQTSEYTPSPKIWEDKAGFDAATANFAKAVSEAKGKIKDIDSLKATMPSIGKSCSGCHETYRVKNS